MESTREFTGRAIRIQSEAILLSRQICGSNAEVNKWMYVAKKRGMSWVDGLSFAVDRMQRGIEEVGCDAQLQDEASFPLGRLAIIAGDQRPFV